MRALLATLVLALAAAPVVAQLDSKQATSQFKAQAKSRLADLKSMIADHEGDAMSAIEGFEGQIAANGYVPQDAADFFVALDGHVGDIAGVLYQQGKGLADDASDLLAQITDPEVVAGTPPKDFAAGKGGVFDVTRDKMAAATEKVLSAIFKRLNKTIKLLDKLEVNMVVLHRPLPASQLAFAPDAAGTHASEFPVNLTLDMAMSFSTTATDDDGIVCIAGQANGASVDVGAGQVETTDTPDSNQRWHHVFGLVTGMPEGDTFVAVSFTGGGQDSAVIAVL